MAPGWPGAWKSCRKSTCKVYVEGQAEWGIIVMVIVILRCYMYLHVLLTHQAIDRKVICATKAVEIMPRSQHFWMHPSRCSSRR